MISPGIAGRRWFQLGLPVLLTLAALGLRLWHLDYLSIWYDEGRTAYHASLPALEHWTRAVVNKPPLFYHITALFWSPGDGAFLLRLPAALFGALTVFLAWHLGKALAGTQGAVLLACLMLLSDINLRYSQEARNYTLLTVGWLLVALSALRLVQAAAEPRPPLRHLLLLGAGCLVMSQTHPIAVHYLSAAGASYLLALRLAGRLTRPYVLYPFIACLLAGLAVLPWIVMTIAQKGGSFDWLEQPSVATALGQFARLSGGGWFMPILSLAGLLLYAGRQRRPEGVLLLGLLLLPPLLIWLTGLVKPLYMLRTIMPVHVIAMAGLMLLLTGLRSRWLQAVAAVCVFAAMSMSAHDYFTKYKKADWRGLSQQILARASPQDIMVLCETRHAGPVHFYLGKDMPRAFALKRYTSGTPVALDVQVCMKHHCDRLDCSAHASTHLPFSPRVAWPVLREGKKHCRLEQLQADLETLTGGKYAPGPTWKGHRVSLTPLVRVDRGAGPGAGP